MMELAAGGALSSTADVVVIGAGVIGGSIALELSRTGRRVTVVDKGPGPGFGSTSASSALIRFSYSTWEGVAVAWESKHRWAAWEDFLGYRDPAGMARFRQVGMAVLDVPLVPREKSKALFDRAGIPYEDWDEPTLRRRLPGLDTGSYFPPKPVGSEEFFAGPHGNLGALYTPDAGYVDDPRLAAANLAAAAVARGAAFVFGRRVVALRRAGAVWRAGLDDGTVLEAPAVVNAAGPWSGPLNALAQADGDFAVHVRPMRQEVHQVKAPGRLPADGTFPAIADMDLGVYLRPEPGGQLLVGGLEPECDPLEWIDDPDAASPLPTASRFEAQVLRAARRLPGLQVPNRPSGIAGVYDVSDDWIPIYDRTSLPGFYVAIGTSGNQFKNAPIVGSLLAAIISATEDGHDHDADPVHFTCPATGLVVDLGGYSRRRARNPDSTGTVMG